MTNSIMPGETRTQLRCEQETSTARQRNDYNSKSYYYYACAYACRYYKQAACPFRSTIYLREGAMQWLIRK